MFACFWRVCACFLEGMCMVSEALCMLDEAVCISLLAQAFEYTSGCSLPTSGGTISGSFQMVWARDGVGARA